MAWVNSIIWYRRKLFVYREIIVYQKISWGSIYIILYKLDFLKNFLDDFSKRKIFVSSLSISSIFVSRISKNYYHNARNGTKGSGGKVEGGRANRDTWAETCRLETRNLGTNALLRNCYIFTELIEDVMEQVYKVEFGGPDENARHAARDDMILKWRCNSDIGASALQREDCFTLFLGGAGRKAGNFHLALIFPQVPKLSNTNLNFRRNFPAV